MAQVLANRSATLRRVIPNCALCTGLGRELVLRLENDAVEQSLTWHEFASQEACGQSRSACCPSAQSITVK